MNFGLIYFLNAPEVGRVKIGFTDCEGGRRVRSLRLANAVDVEPLAYIRGVKDTEQLIHGRFDDRRHHGEWFDLAPDLRMFIDDFATTWPSVGFPSLPLRVPVAIARKLTTDTRAAVAYWEVTRASRRRQERINWSQWLPAVENWSLAMTHALADLCPRVRRPDFTVTEDGQRVRVPDHPSP